MDVDQLVVVTAAVEQYDKAPFEKSSYCTAVLARGFVTSWPQRWYSPLGFGIKSNPAGAVAVRKVSLKL